MKFCLIIFFLVPLALDSAFSAPLVPDYIEAPPAAIISKKAEAKAPQANWPSSAEEQFNLARRFLKGSDIIKDEKLAFEFMTAAANQGHVEALGGLGYFYANGIAVEKNETVALEWIRKGAELGSPKAQLNLGLLLLAKTKEGNPDRAEGFRWIKAAADQGLAEALSAQGSIHCLGLYDQPVDYEQAYIYLSKAAEQFHPDAQHLLGVIFEKGLGRPANRLEAEAWYRKAALQDHPESQANLANLLSPSSRDISRRIEALTWLICAARHDNSASKKILTEIYFKITPAELSLATKRALQVSRDATGAPGE